MTTTQLTDIYSPDTYAREMPYGTFAELRRDAPVYWQREPEGPGYWALTRYEDIVTVSTDNILFSSYMGGTNLEDMPADGLAMIRMMMVNMDPPQHTKYRRLVATGFTPKMIHAMEPHVRDITRRIVDDVAQRSECDFVTEISAKLPLHVIAEIMGVPQDMHAQIFDWSNKLIGFTDPEYAITPETSQQA
ncbi:MAG TPA: cytochrome P450, partial [Dehalococcoidia bacterium]|nr:cytochrome P450 [Dehalococcoidia bacterium]